MASSGRGRAGGRTASAKRARASASRRSVFASRPAARAKARTWRGLATATGKPAAARAAGEAELQPAGGLQHDERRSRGGQALGEPRHALVVVVGGEALAGGARVDVEPVLGDVDADEGGSLVHDPSSLDAGFSAPVTVRVAGTRPAGRHALPRPRWTCGRAGSSRPARSRHQIGSRQHTKGAVENLNGRAQHSLPRESPPEALARARLRRLAERLDDTPRRRLGYRTPREVFWEHLAAPDRPALEPNPDTCGTSRRYRRVATLHVTADPVTEASPWPGCRRRPARPTSRAPSPGRCCGRRRRPTWRA